jgi:hypothetical protein
VNSKKPGYCSVPFPFCLLYLQSEKPPGVKSLFLTLDTKTKVGEFFMPESAECFTAWQVSQAEHALKIFYEVFLPGYVPETAAKPVQEEKGQAGNVGARAGTFRDRVIPGEVERLFSPLLDALKTEIRSRHYSIALYWGRTELTH